MPLQYASVWKELEISKYGVDEERSLGLFRACTAERRGCGKIRVYEGDTKQEAEMELFH